MSIDMAEKARDSRLRSRARRAGLSLMRSRTRNPRASDYGLYIVVDTASATVVAGGQTGYNMTQDDVEEFLSGQWAESGEG